MTKNLSLKTVKIKIRSNMDNKGTLAEQQQINLCQSAIDKGNAYSPACYFGQGIYVAGSNK